MKKIRVYGLNNCDTCRKARKWLERQGRDFEFIDYREHPVGQDALRDWAAQVGGWEKLVNRSSTTWRNLPEDRKQPAGEQWLALVTEHPQLVKRPVLVTADGVASVGFSEAGWQARLAG
ncbi:arsenate reductase [Pigmentiphaga sp. NML080357]|uniref:Spx/MgsR family RNA polymerase-binding regulatory protein n=1 Tax=Pigmentiphaga sp. NML080357 TaxID=2008675 RepID=UPI000B40B390|nr:Spx/MgsR family RNA polymerase-binding regulatory protein [Pigmentiphaga sp. NML080357]OVZ59039.1 arsenate reductase [Pigmentiphaga sp. NML080357]